MFKLSTFHYLVSDSILVVFVLKFFLLFNLCFLHISCLGKFWPFCTFYLHVKVNFCSMILVNTHLKTRTIGTSLSLFLALVEFKGRLFSYLNNLMGWNYNGKNMWKGWKDARDQCHFYSNLCPIKVFVPTSLSASISPIPPTIGLNVTTFNACKIWWGWSW